MSTTAILTIIATIPAFLKFADVVKSKRKPQIGSRPVLDAFRRFLKRTDYDF